MRPRCSVLTGGFDFSGCGDGTSCPPIARAEMNNSAPSAIVLHGIPRIGELYIKVRVRNGENGSLKVRPDSPFLNRTRVFRTGSGLKNGVAVDFRSPGRLSDNRTMN